MYLHYLLQKVWQKEFTHKEMYPLYVSELNTQILELKANLERVPIKGGGALQKHPKKSRYGERILSSIDAQICSVSIDIGYISPDALQIPARILFEIYKFVF